MFLPYQCSVLASHQFRLGCPSPLPCRHQISLHVQVVVSHLRWPNTTKQIRWKLFGRLFWLPAGSSGQIVSSVCLPCLSLATYGRIMDKPLMLQYNYPNQNCKCRDTKHKQPNTDPASVRTIPGSRCSRIASSCVCTSRRRCSTAASNLPFAYPTAP